MDWTHPEHPGRRVRLAYCLNLHPATDLKGVLEGMRTISLPLAQRLGGGSGFGVGPWLPATAAEELAADENERARFAGFLRDAGLVAFTYNAFPYGAFHRAGLKERVFQPTWREEARELFTRAVARVAVAAAGTPDPTRHLSISTHPGAFGADVQDKEDQRAAARGFARAALDLRRLAEESGWRVVLSLEAEPRASAGDTRELASFLAFVRREGARFLAESEGLPPEEADWLLARHLGTCLDACHAAVEFEPANVALAQSTAGGTPLGKLQFSSALRLPNPGADAVGRERLLGLAEPVYLHQVTGHLPDGSRLAVTDLPELAQALEHPRSPWLAASEWRCHFHVPVDLGGPLDAATMGGLAATRDDADRVLDAALAAPETWASQDLHLEIETYTWSVLPTPARGTGALLDGLEREYRHVQARLESAGWRR